MSLQTMTLEQYIIFGLSFLVGALLVVLFGLRPRPPEFRIDYDGHSYDLRRREKGGRYALVRSFNSRDEAAKAIPHVRAFPEYIP